MSRPVYAKLVIAAAIALATACGNTAGGGGTGNQNVGGAPGGVCNPDFHNQGCFAGKKVNCDTATTKWVDAGECAQGEYCAEKADPADATGAKKIATCEKQAVYTSDATGDASGDGTTSSGDGGTTTTKTPAEQFACVQQKCATEYATCAANAVCAAALACIGKCTDEACASACPEVPDSDTAATAAATSVVTCGLKNGCLSLTNGTGTVCGNGQCEDGETVENCALDCKKTGPACGDGKCDVGETPSTCASDCKPDGPKCGNEKCEKGETPSTCPLDCKPDGPKCGNNICEAGETPSTCASDCKATECTSSNQCKTGQKCEAGKCVTDAQPECSLSKPCPTGKTCVSGKCEVSTPSGSCAGKCGKYDGDANCQCDESCTEYGDCCSDYDKLCKTP